MKAVTVMRLSLTLMISVPVIKSAPSVNVLMRAVSATPTPSTQMSFVAQTSSVSTVSVYHKVHRVDNSTY